jgi:hypothetical protein
VNSSRSDTTIRALRTQLIEARRQRSLPLLQQVEEGLLYLGRRGYRCCLLDYERGRTRYYVRLLGYANARVKAQIEFPIASNLRSIQWLPLSHLADFDEVDAPYKVGQIYEALSGFIHRRQVPLSTVPRALPRPRRRPRSWLRDGSDMPERAMWWYVGSACVVFLAIGGLIALRMGNVFY